MALLLPFPPPIRNFFSHSSGWRGGALRRRTTLNLLAPSLPSPFPDLHSLIDQHFCAKGALICLVIDALVEATLSRTILEEGRWNLLELDFDPSLEKMSSPLASPNNSSSSSNPSSTSPPPPSSPAASSPTSDPSPPPTSPSFSKSSSPLPLGLHNKFRLGTLPLAPPGSSSSSPVLPSPTSSAFTTSHYEAEKSTPLTTISPPSIEDHRSGLNLTMVIGVATGIGLFFVLVIIICICCKKKQTKNRHHNPMQYYNDASVYKDSGFYSTEPPPKWHNDEHVVKVPPIPGGGWHPPRAPSIMNSDDMGSGFTGPKGPLMPPPSPAIALGLNTSTFTYEELSCATNGFSHANLLGQGGFGFVYKGVLPNGKDIAVKQLKSGSGQGEREFHAEVDIISRVHHRHLVFLVGYCICGSHRILVYEYVPNNTLEYHLHGKGVPVMDWSRRLKIALGSGRGIAYLHEDCNPRIIHRDIKSANILLDLKFEAMVADFGLAKLSSDNHTHVSTRVMGTFGYLAPEYASSGKLTQKSDVFSYGVMLLEIITGRRPVDSHAFMEDSLVDWARPLLSRALADGDYDEIADRRLNGNYDPVEMARMVACAAACVRHSAKKRPKMSQIVKALEGDVSLEELNEGMRPGQSMMFSSGSEYESSSYTSSMNRLRKVMLPSPEFTGEYSGTIPEYDPRHSGSSDDAFSSELSPVENQRHKAGSPL